MKYANKLTEDLKENMLEYKGYYTIVRYNAETGVLRGIIEGINDFVNFQTDSLSEVKSEFYQAVDRYLEFCKKIGKEPEIPNSQIKTNSNINNSDEFVKEQLKFYPNANKKVIRFCADFLYHNNKFQNEHSEEDAELIRLQFHSGYCYYFAHMLKLAFRRGEVVWCAPFGHFAWQDTDGQVYDIEGVSTTEAEYFIPEYYLGDAILDFLHVEGESYNASKKDIQHIINNYLKNKEK